MTPRQAIASLDHGIRKNGQTVILRRGTTSAPTAMATVKAHVRGYKPDELVGGIIQGDSQVILSPRLLAAAGWPGDIRRGDWLTFDGKVRSVEVVMPRRMDDVLVRIELQVRG